MGLVEIGNRAYARYIRFPEGFAFTDVFNPCGFYGVVRRVDRSEGVVEVRGFQIEDHNPLTTDVDYVSSEVISLKREEDGKYGFHKRDIGGVVAEVCFGDVITIKRFLTGIKRCDRDLGLVDELDTRLFEQKKVQR